MSLHRRQSRFRVQTKTGGVLVEGEGTMESTEKAVRVLFATGEGKSVAMGME